MSKAIKIDPETGLKIFDTKASLANNKIIGQGYSVNNNIESKTLPDEPVGAIFNAKEQEKYKNFKEKRAGAANYMEMKGDYSRYLEDPYTAEPVKRASLKDYTEILIVGAGFAGLLLWHKLQKSGFQDVRFCEKGGDVGGTWYWNRYPGVACDVESYSYLPLLEEMDYFPTMKFASGFEIMEYCQKMASKFNFYDKCLFHTTVEKTIWDKESKLWKVYTDRGDIIEAKYVILANGLLTSPRLAKINGMDKFSGQSFHTSRWDYNIDLKDKKVGIIGTGATAVQVVPEISKITKELYIFQRTPSSIDVRDQRETTQEEIREWKEEENWAKARRARFAKISSGRAAIQGNDEYLSGKIDDYKERKNHNRDLSIEELLKKQLAKNFRIMEQIRSRVDQIVDDPKIAESLKPYYPYGCKRPAFHDEFLSTFNLPNVHLIDTSPKGVSEINERGVVHDNNEYQLDILIYATGFNWMEAGTFNTVIGEEGLSLSEKAKMEGTKTFLGIHSNGFPNLFIVTGPQGGGTSFNFTDAIENHSDYILWMLNTMKENNYNLVDVDKNYENEYANHCKEVDIQTSSLRDCITYYNGEGKAEPGSLSYYGGGQWHKIRLDAQRNLKPYIFTQF
ncbi:MAG: NAD(P)/FAD-dependent oxidoreductase [Pseudomonadota bacterium]|nr:NAD(P)/FAD-dependent oxidoreductase [Pseudomonadota bacterium]